MTSPALKWDAELPDRRHRSRRARSGAPAHAPLPPGRRAARRARSCSRDGAAQEAHLLRRGLARVRRPRPTSASCWASFSSSAGRSCAWRSRWRWPCCRASAGGSATRSSGIGVLRPIELFRAIHDQTQERLVEIFRWKAGEIAFARGRALAGGDVPARRRSVRAHRPGHPRRLLRTRSSRRCSPRSARRCSSRVTAPPVRLEMFRLPDARGGGPRGRHRQDDPQQARRAARPTGDGRSRRRCCARSSSVWRASCCGARSGSCRRASCEE